MGLTQIVIGVIVGLIVFYVTYIIFLSPQRKFKKACMVYEKIEKLRPERMSVREPLAHEYQPRDQDSKLCEILQRGESWLLLRGNSWTGKSHSAYEALKRLSQGGLKGYWVIRPAHEVKAQDIHLLKQFPSRRPKIVLVLDNLESYMDPGRANRIYELTERFQLQSKEMRVLATMRTESEFVDAAQVAQKDIAWPRFKTIDFNSPIPDVVANNETHLEDMRTKYRSLQDAPKKILWALKILRRGRVTPLEVRAKALFVEKLNGEEKEFEAGLTRLKHAGFAGSARPDVTEVHDTYLEQVVEDFPEEPQQIWEHLRQAAQLFDKYKDINAINQIGMVFHLNEKHDDALRCCDVILRITDEKDPEAWYNKGLTLYKLDRHQEAKQCFEKTLELREDYPEAWVNKGVALAGLSRHEKAIECYDKALELREDYPKASYNKGNSLDELGRHEEAIQCYDKVLELREDFPEAWVNKGVALADLGRHEEAIQCHNKALELRRDYPRAWNNKGAALYHLGRLEKRPELFQEAIQCYDEALELREDYPEALGNKGNAFLELGQLEKKPELLKQAMKCFDKATELRKDYLDAWNNKSVVLIRLSHTEQKPELFRKAIESCDKAIEVQKDYPSAWYNKACAFAGLKEKDKMLEALKEAVRLDPENKAEAKKDEDFKAYWDDEDFKAVVK